MSEPLVLIPGLLCTPRLFEAQVASLAGGRQVIVADHTRHDSVELVAADILGQVMGEFALLGLSMGGYLAFEIMRQARDRVTRLALLDTNARADTAEQREVRNRLIHLGHTEGPRKVQQVLMSRLVHQRVRSDKALVEAILQMADDTGPEAHERQQRAIMGRPDSRLSMSGIRVPTLVLVGREDQITPPKMAEEMHSAIAGSRLVVLDTCGHLSVMEQANAVTAELERWLDEPLLA
jgi:pimeloyl-ACP methyl ester carboxylesterase